MCPRYGHFLCVKTIHKQQQVKRTEIYSDKKILRKSRLQLYSRHRTATLAHRSNSHGYHKYWMQYRLSHDIIRSKMAMYYDQTTAVTWERWKNGTHDTDIRREFCFAQFASIQRQYNQKHSTWYRTPVTNFCDVHSKGCSTQGDPRHRTCTSGTVLRVNVRNVKPGPPLRVLLRQRTRGCGRY
jgi:hypothetical protein